MSLPRWDTSDLHTSLDARSFVDDLEAVRADLDRLEADFDARGVGAVDARPVTDDDAEAADALIDGYNGVMARLDVLRACAYATVTTDSRHERAQSVWSELSVLSARSAPLVARLAAWTRSLGADELAARSVQAAEHAGPLLRLAERAEHQMPETLEHLYSELTPTGSLAWARLQADVTSQLTATVRLPDGTDPVLPMPAVRGLASSTSDATRRAAFEAELEAWPRVAVACAAAMNAVKGEAVVVNRRRRWATPLDAALFANSVSRPTFEAMHAAVVRAMPDFRRWMRAKARLHGHADALPWWDLVAPLPSTTGAVGWDDGMATVERAFGTYDTGLARLARRAVDESWIDAEPRDGKVGGAFCMPLAGDRSLVLLNWSDSAEAVQTAAHELGHAYHNTQLAHRTPLQRRLPMALAETASIFCETLVTESGLEAANDEERLHLLDVDLRGANQVVVDIHSRFLFETEVFARRERRSLGVGELDELMLECQAAAYGDGLVPASRHPHMWVLKPHYYGSHFYNWPYTYGLLFGLGLFARYRLDPERFRAGYDDLLSRAGMDTAEQLGQRFGLDVSDESFWEASLDVLRARITDYESLARASSPRDA